MVVKIFVFGCPGSGKSTAANTVVSLLADSKIGWRAFHLSDYGLLFEWFKSKSEPEKFRETEYGGFEVVDETVYHRVLLDLKKMILDAEKQLTNKQILVIEFARSDYQESLRLLGKEFIQDAYFLFIDADVDTCWQRILERVINRDTINDHFVPLNILETYRDQGNSEYSERTLSFLREDYGVDDRHCLIVYNVSDHAKEDLNTQITDFLSSIIEDHQDENEQFSGSDIAHRQIIGYDYQGSLIPGKFAYSSS